MTKRNLSCALIAGFLLAVPALAAARVIERIVAIVNDQSILQSDVDNFRKKLTIDGLVDESLVALAGKDMLTKDRNALVNFLIDEKVLDSEVKKRGLEVTFERVEQEIRNILKAKHINRNQLKDILADKSATLSDYQTFIKSSIERQSLIDREVSSRIKISDEDIAAHYLRTKGPAKGQAYEYSLAHILFLPANGGEKAARERARQALEKLKKGQPFEKLAEQNSEDPNFSKDGFLGDFRTGEMKKEIEEGVKSLTAGEISQPIKTSMGIHVVKVLKKKVTGDPALEAKKDEIRNELYAEIFKRQFRSWLDQRREEAFVRINAAQNAVAK
jgi:parvulin-like peptidyl-prolyl isomerase